MHHTNIKETKHKRLFPIELYHPKIESLKNSIMCGTYPWDTHTKTKKVRGTYSHDGWFTTQKTNTLITKTQKNDKSHDKKKYWAVSKLIVRSCIKFLE